MARVWWGFLVGACLCSAGCVEQPAAERIVGPDGTQMLHVHCGKEQVACFQIAGERCPHGYDLSPIFDPREGNFLVRCRYRAPAPIVISTSPLVTQPRPRSAQPRPAEDGWPPSEVAMPTEPWPAPSSAPPPAPPRTSSSAVDLGY